MPARSTAFLIASMAGLAFLGLMGDCLRRWLFERGRGWLGSLLERQQ